MHALQRERLTKKGLRNVAVDNDKSVGQVWPHFLPEVLHTYNYENTHSAIGITPAEAFDENQEIEFRTNLESKRKNVNRYPELEVGDKVRFFRKRGAFAKEGTGIWHKELTKITRIEKSPTTGQTMYHVRTATIMNKPYAINEICKIDGGPIREAVEPEEKDEDSTAR